MFRTQAYETGGGLPLPPPAEPVAPSRAATIAARALDRLWQGGVLPAPTLDADQLIAGAIAAERDDDFGPGHWETPFRLLVADLAGPARLNAIGRTFAHVQLTKTLRDRLRAQRLWQRHPEILETPLPRPVVVLGSMRSGTTRMQRLLACDPRLAHTRLHESQNPVPGRLGRAGGWASTAAGVALLRLLNPALMAVHPTAAQLPDEEFGLFGFAMNGAQFDAQWHVPGFSRHWQHADPRPVYAEFRALLQTIAWARGGDARPWVLKAPHFLEHLDALLGAFPDARLVCLSRDAPSVVASSASLVWQQQRVQSDHVCRRRIGQDWLARTAARVEAAAQVRAARPDVPQIDVRFADVDADWRREMARVQDFLGLAFTPQVAARMAKGLDRAVHHHGHRYRLADFGLTETRVREALPHGA